MVYEISHNLVQEESHPDLFPRPVWVHRKGATRALPAGHPMLAGHALAARPATRSSSPAPWATPPTSCGRCRARPAALYSVNHGCGRRKSRTAARREITPGPGRPARCATWA